MRRALIERDLVDCVLGLGPNLFYNSPMEACVVVCRTRKPPKRRGRVLFLDAVREVARERAQSFLTAAHQQRILKAYRVFADEPGFAAVATTADVLANDGNLSIPRYVRRPADAGDVAPAGDLRSAGRSNAPRGAPPAPDRVKQVHADGRAFTKPMRRRPDRSSQNSRHQTSYFQARR